MESTKLSYREWASAIYLLVTKFKPVSSMKLRRDLDIARKSAWILVHSIRESYLCRERRFDGSVEADENSGSHRANMRKLKLMTLRGRGAGDEVADAGVKYGVANRVREIVVLSAVVKKPKGFIRRRTEKGVTVCTDRRGSYVGMHANHEMFCHSIDEFVRKQEAYTQGIHSFWSMFKRARRGTFHWFSRKYLDFYVTKFTGHHCNYETYTFHIVGRTVAGLAGKRLRYRDLTVGNDLALEAQS